MKPCVLRCCFGILAFFSIPLIQFPAGAGELEQGKAPLILNDHNPALVRPTWDSRFRYEYGDVDGFDVSHAETLRNRIGLLTRKTSGLQFFGEYEGTIAWDRNSYRAASVHGPATKTIIADPESHELNQLWGSYETGDGQMLLKAGRQAINLDNQRYVGGVAWRQNMQTFDAASLLLKRSESLDIYYGYVSQINRIFGSDVTAPIHTDFEGNSHFVNIKYRGIPAGELTVYTYLLDLSNAFGDSNSNNSFGFSLSGNLGKRDLDYYFEYGFQSNAFDNPVNYRAHYGHAHLEGPILCDRIRAGAGLEYLGSNNNVGYRFPLGTNHKFNGFADVFLNTPAAGLTDLYTSISADFPGGVQGSIYYHYFHDDGFNVSFGHEADIVLKKPLSDRVHLLGKGAFFFGQNGFPDVTRMSVGLNIHY